MSDFPKEVLISGRVRVCLDLVKRFSLRGKVVVDIGSSFGWLEKELIKEKPKTLYGIESNKAAVDFARTNVPGVEFIHGDGAKIPLKKSSADLLILFDVLEHVPAGSENTLLGEINRVLKKGGTLLLSTPNQHFLSNLFDVAWYFGHRHYSKETVSKMLAENGFKVAQLETKGSILSSLYLTWFYIAKRILGTNQPRSSFFEKLDDDGYQKTGITDIFLSAIKI